MTCIITEPCIDIKDRSCVDVCRPVDCIHAVRADSRHRSGGVHRLINRLTDEYAAEHNVQNPPLEPR